MLKPICLLITVLCLTACGDRISYRDQSVPITTIPALDEASFLGRWYEVARYSTWFEEGCEGVTAEYARRPDGRYDVTNTCRDSMMQITDIANGVARTTDTDGQLEVSFVPILPFVWGDYWVLELDPDSGLLVVGNPAGRTGWILARTPTLPAATLAQAEAVLQQNGYDPGALLFPMPFETGN